MVFFAITALVGVFFGAVFNSLMRGAVVALLESSASPLALAAVTAGVLSHALLTAAVPAETTIYGRLDAMATGLTSAMKGMFWALATYRLLLAAMEGMARLMNVSAPESLQFVAACGALEAGNFICIKKLFDAAYTPRDELPMVGKVKLDTHGRKAYNMVLKEPGRSGRMDAGVKGLFTILHFTIFSYSIGASGGVCFAVNDWSRGVLAITRNSITTIRFGTIN